MGCPVLPILTYFDLPGYYVPPQTCKHLKHGRKPGCNQLADSAANKSVNEPRKFPQIIAQISAQISPVYVTVL